MPKRALGLGHRVIGLNGSHPVWLIGKGAYWGIISAGILLLWILGSLFQIGVLWDKFQILDLFMNFLRVIIRAAVAAILFIALMPGVIAAWKLRDEAALDAIESDIFD